MIKLCGAALIALILSAVLKQRSSVLAPYISEIAGITLLFSAVSSLAPIVTLFRSYSIMNDSNEMIKTLLSAFSVALICQTICSISRSQGENSLANALEFAGGSEIILMSLPYIKEILDLIFGGLGI